MVTVTKQENVGPYATVQLHSTDASALNNWLTQNGFNIPADVTPVIDQYVTEGADFLAMKLLPGQGIQSMRPVRVTTPGASLTLPLRMAAIGTGPIVGITIWVVADGRYEPQNFPFFRIDDTQLVWDFAISASNYTTLRVQNEAQTNNKAWEIESSITLNEQVITNAIVSGGQVYPGGLGTAAPSDPALDYLPIGTPPDAGGGGDGGDDAGGYQSADEVRTADISTLFVGLSGPNVRVTRIRSDIAHAAMTADLVLQASTDQSDLSNFRNVTQAINNRCPIAGATNSSTSPGGVAVGFSSSGIAGSNSTSSATSASSAGAAPSSGCSCRMAGASPAGSMAALAGLGAGLSVVVRRRRRRDRSDRRLR
jgi:MYXO-CTERM domain-containing protein